MSSFERLLRDCAPYLAILFVGGALVFAAEQVGGEGLRGPAFVGVLCAIGLWALWDIFRARPGDDPDPFGRSLFLALRHERRARRARRRPLTFSSATTENCPPGRWDNMTSALSLSPEFMAIDGEQIWLAAERDWWGWPDPPRYVVLAFEAGGELVAAADFNDWPSRWNKPAGSASDG